MSDKEVGVGIATHVYLLTSYREPTTDQSSDTTRVQHGEAVGFIGVIYRSVGEGLHSRSRNDSESSHTTEAHSSMGDISQSWGPGAPCTACRQLSVLESVLSE